MISALIKYFNNNFATNIKYQILKQRYYFLKQFLCHF